jgi:adenine phosphoribosyltransferase
VEKLGGTVTKVIFLIELVDLKGRDKLKGYDVGSVAVFEGE